MNRKLFNTTAALLLTGLPALAQQGPGAPSEAGHPVAIVLLVVIVGLAIAIAILGNAVLGAMDIYRERARNKAGNALLAAGIIGTLYAQDAAAQSAAPPAATRIVSGLSNTSFYALISVITLELLVLMCLLYALRILAGIKRKPRIKKAPAPGKPKVSWMERLNKTKSLDTASEAEADMGHDFDGIRELNNPTPPWWKWGFYFSIAFGVVYCWRYQVAHSAPSQLEELALAEAKAAEAKAAYLQNAANNIDETNVMLLAEAADLAAGKQLFTASCAPCHGPQGQGVVGPNLTDDYWLHGGSINDIFKTIKYGVPEKGMRAWKDDFSPRQLAQLSSFIKSIHGSNPPNAKEPQGEPFTEKQAAGSN